MTQEEFGKALQILFENFWVLRNEQPEEYFFLRRHENELQKELRNRFGMNLIVRSQSIQLIKKPHERQSWMGDIGFASPFEFSLFCCGLAFIEGLELETPFMLDEMIREIELTAPEELQLDWTNYNQRKSLVRILKKLLEFQLIELIQGEMDAFEDSEVNQEVLYTTTVQARSFLSRAPKSYIEYETFMDFWEDVQAHTKLEGNQLLHQRLMIEPVIYRTPENEEFFVRLRNYHHHLKKFVSENTPYELELYRDYVSYTIEQREGLKEVFPSRKVIDEILIQLSTVLREKGYPSNSYGIIELNDTQWDELIGQLQKEYQVYWSKEFSQMTKEQLSQELLRRGCDWQLFKKNETQIKIQPTFGRLIGEMRQEDE